LKDETISHLKKDTNKGGIKAYDSNKKKIYNSLEKNNKKNNGFFTIDKNNKMFKCILVIKNYNKNKSLNNTISNDFCDMNN
jgi:hypothetical protein